MFDFCIERDTVVRDYWRLLRVMRMVVRVLYLGRADNLYDGRNSDETATAILAIHSRLNA